MAQSFAEKIREIRDFIDVHNVDRAPEVQYLAEALDSTLKLLAELEARLETRSMPVGRTDPARW